MEEIPGDFFTHVFSCAHTCDLKIEFSGEAVDPGALHGK